MQRRLKQIKEKIKRNKIKWLYFDSISQREKVDFFAANIKTQFCKISTTFYNVFKAITVFAGGILGLIR